MSIKRSLPFFAVFCLSAVSLYSEQWYRVSETELAKLEAISRSSETDRQNWLSQAGELKVIVQSLQKGSKSLNEQLEKEREATKTLRQSFEQSAAEQLKRASDYETEIASLKAEKALADLAVEKIKNQRNVLFFILSAFALALSAIIYVKIKTFFIK